MHQQNAKIIFCFSRDFIIFDYKILGVVSCSLSYNFLSHLPIYAIVFSLLLLKRLHTSLYYLLNILQDYFLFIIFVSFLSPSVLFPTSNFSFLR